MSLKSSARLRPVAFRCRNRQTMRSGLKFRAHSNITSSPMGATVLSGDRSMYSPNLVMPVFSGSEPLAPLPSTPSIVHGATNNNNTKIGGSIPFNTICVWVPASRLSRLLQLWDWLPLILRSCWDDLSIGSIRRPPSSHDTCISVRVITICNDSPSSPPGSEVWRVLLSYVVVQT